MNEKILASIKIFVDKTSFQDSFFRSVLERLISFNYILKEDDAWVISFCIIKVENRIKNFCNISEVPHELNEIAVDMVIGEFLLALKNTGKLEINELDLNGTITSIKEGDTQVNFDTNTSDESKIDYLINYLLNSKEGDLICFRKIRW